MPKISENIVLVVIIAKLFFHKNLVNPKTGAGKEIAKIPAYPKLNTTTENLTFYN
jgi:hypothetical protein